MLHASIGICSDAALSSRGNEKTLLIHGLQVLRNEMIRLMFGSEEASDVF